MTHDELMDKIRGKWVLAAFKVEDVSSYKALTAVVELHKPYQHEVVSYVFCRGCTLDLDLAPPYPCETIKAIENEL